MGQFEITGTKGARVENLVLINGYESIVNAIAENVAPEWSYVAVGLGTTTPASADTALVSEIYRNVVTSRWQLSGSARMVAIFGSNVACGNWKELGVFAGTAERVSLSSCDGTAGWSSDGVLTQETSVVNEGAASLRCYQHSGQHGTLIYRNTTLAPDVGGAVLGTATYLYFWYRVSVSPWELTVRAGADADNYYYWTWTPSASDAWECFYEQVWDAAGTVGAPGTAFSFLQVTHADSSTTRYEYLDGIFLFNKSGTLMARAIVDINKAWDTVRSVHYTFGWD